MRRADLAHSLGDAGTTILEVLIATMLLSVLAMTIFTAFALGLRAAALAAGQQTATGLAEELLALATASPCGGSFASTPGVGRDADTASPLYDRSLTVRAGDRPGLYEITATVTWTRERATRTVTLTTWRYVSAACRLAGP